MNVADFRYGFRFWAGAMNRAGWSCWRRPSPPTLLVTSGAECGREAYLSAFLFAAEFADHLKATGSTKGYAGPCWSAWVWWDIDSEELPHAHAAPGARPLPW